MTFQQELRKSLRAHGPEIAIEQAGKQISYAALSARADKITRFLLAGEAGAVIGILLSNKVDLIASIIGIANARGVFVPLDGALPEKRLTVMLNDLRPSCILSSRSDAPAPGVTGATRVHYLEDITGEEENQADWVANHAGWAEDLPLPEFDPEDSLYIYFTSGSTGNPKGIIGKNKSLLQFIQWEAAAFDLVSGTRFSQFISPYFDAFLRDVFVPLLAGGIICIPPAEDDFFTPEKMRPWIGINRIHVIHCVPSVFRIFNHHSLSPDDYQDLRYVFMSGEKIIPSELVNWYDILGSRVQLVNFYGATETTMIRAFYKIRPEDVHRTRIPVGGPIADTQLLIAREDGSPCGPLVTGDLYIISSYVTRGYLNAPALTHEKFLQVSPGSGETLAFKTGDKARWTATGEVDLLGREDRQVKLRGIRIELDEIENALDASGWVKQAVVIASQPEEGKEEAAVSLAAFVIRQEGKPADVDLSEVLFRHLKDSLPEYMIPSRWVELEQFPELSNGKINYAALLAIPATRPVIAPVNEIEEKILAIWKDILDGKLISTSDNFLSVGGNSIGMMRLIGKLYKTFNTRVSLDDVFENLTISKQAELISRLSVDHLLTIARVETKPAYHLSSVQERLYAQVGKNKQDTVFNLPMAWEASGELDKDKVQAALIKLIERHESLRTEFRFLDGKLVQVVKDSVVFRVEEIDSRNGDISGAIGGFIRPFDLDTAPLIRCGILSCPEGKKMIVLDLHHIICDGTSQAILLSEFLSLYDGKIPPPPALQYKDYAEWEYHFKSTEEYIRQKEFWLQRFEGSIPVLELPVLNSPGKESSTEGDTLFFKMDKAVLQPILGSLKEEDITHFSGLFSIFFLFLSQLTGQDDIVIGTNTSGRIQEELNGMIGMLVKTLPIRYKLDVKTSFSDFTREMHRLLVQARSKQVYDLADILHNLNAGRSQPVTSLFDAMFVFLDFDVQQPASSEEFVKYEFGNKTAKYPITLFVAEGKTSFNFRLEYSTRYFSKTDAELLILQFKKLCRKIAGNPQSMVMAFFGDELPADSPMEDMISFNF
ncbi:MAG TPA: amino acid adenylation domain-containing protein [Puia sp.]|nr:amino acid adenylation domain-containing protein [Puia sp.]